MLSLVRSCPLGEEWFSHSRLYKSSDWWQKGNSENESPSLQVQVSELWLWLSGTDILCTRQSQLHSSLCKVCGRSIEGDGTQRCSPSLGCIVGHNQGDSHSSSWVSLCSAFSIGKNRRERAKCHSWWKWPTRLYLYNRYSCVVRLPHIDRKSRGNQQ